MWEEVYECSAKLVYEGALELLNSWSLPPSQNKYSVYVQCNEQRLVMSSACGRTIIYHMLQHCQDDTGMLKPWCFFTLPFLTCTGGKMHGAYWLLETGGCCWPPLGTSPLLEVPSFSLHLYSKSLPPSLCTV